VFVNIFSFSFDFSFASLNFDHPQNKKNQSGVLLNPSFLLVPFLFIFANPNRRWTTTSPTKNIYFVDGLEKILQAKVTCNTRSKSGGRTSLESPRETPLPRSRGDQPHRQAS
jgi:hypothetical protein